MTNDAEGNFSTLIDYFCPLNQINAKNHQQLTNHLRLVKVTANEVVIKKSSNDEFIHFLVDGCVSMADQAVNTGFNREVKCIVFITITNVTACAAWSTALR